MEKFSNSQNTVTQVCVQWLVCCARHGQPPLLSFLHLDLDEKQTLAQIISSNSIENEKF